MLTLDQAIKIADLPKGGSGGDLIKSITARAASLFLSALPLEIRNLLDLAVDGATAIQELNNGQVGAWLGLIKKAQNKWIEKVAQAWQTPARCRDELWREAAAAFPMETVLSRVPLKSACGVGGARKPGRIYWCAIPGCGELTRIEEWAFDLPPRVGITEHRQSWIPDNRSSRQDGFLFCPAAFPFVAPSQVLTYGPSAGVLPIMALKYQDLVIDGLDAEQLDALTWIFNRFLALINNGSYIRDGKDPTPVQKVLQIPMLPDPAYIYVTPTGELYAATDTAKILTGYETTQPSMIATVVDLKTVLGSMAALMVRQRLFEDDPKVVDQAFGKDVKQGGGFGGQYKGGKIAEDAGSGAGLALGLGLSLVGLAGTGAAVAYFRQRRARPHGRKGRR